MPHFSPWSHETFLARLKTFAPVTMWHPKPEPVNEVAWAKRGWECVDTNTVACKGCQARVQVRFDRTAGQTIDGQETADEDAEQEHEEVDGAVEQGFVERYKALLIDGHTEGCSWRRAGCKADIYRLPIVQTPVWQTQVRTAYASLLAIADAISSVRLRINDEMRPSPEKILSDLPKDFFSPPTDAPETPSSSTQQNRDEQTPSSPPTPQPQPPATPDLAAKALRIALTGWRGTTESRTALLNCDACFQRVGLWMYEGRSSPTENNHKGPGDEEADDGTALDLVEMHREQCPFRNGAVQNMTSEPFAGWPAWRILWSVVARYADERRRRARDRFFDGPGEGEVEEPKVELSREEVARLDKERTNKLRRLKRVFGLGVKRKVDGG